MQCECCGRETDVLIEIGAVSPRVSVSGCCCVECCAFILRALEDRQEEQPAERAEMIPVQDGQVFVDEDGGEILQQEIRFGMKDHDGRIHYFCMRALRVIPEYEAFEIYPKGWKKSDDPERTGVQLSGVRQPEDGGRADCRAAPEAEQRPCYLAKDIADYALPPSVSLSLQSYASIEVIAQSQSC